MAESDRRYFVVKHGLNAFEVLPNFIWRTDRGPRGMPRRFGQVRPGDRWVAFAYTTSDFRERPLSLVTGFYECVTEAKYQNVPKGVPISEYWWRRKGYAWLIEGRPFGRQPPQPVGVPPLHDPRMLGRRYFMQEAVVPITADEFDRIRTYALDRQLDPSKIPLLKREPLCEQELLAAVACGHKQLGIEEIVRVRKAFPDLLVKIDGSPRQVHIELEMYSEGFMLHRHYKQVRTRRFKGDNRPLAVLCWIDNDDRVKEYVHRVYELQSLIRNGERIRW